MMQLNGWKVRFTAAGTHFLASLAVFVVFINVLYWLWYPRPYFSASGGWQGLRLVIFVDLVLGPLLTFAVFNQKKQKRLLVQDLALIIMLQLAALFWGVYLVYQQRPIAIVFWENSFYTVPYQALARHYPDAPLFTALKAQPRQLIYGQKPQDKAGLETMLERTKTLMLAPYQQLEYYRPLAAFFPLITSYTLDINEIVQHNHDMNEQLMQVLEKTGATMHELIYLPLQSRYRNIILIFDNHGKQKGFLQAPYKKDV